MAALRCLGPRQHRRGAARLTQASVEAGALGRREPRPGADPGGEDDQVGRGFEGLLGGPHGGVAVVQEGGVHHRAVDHLRAAASQHLGLFLHRRWPVMPMVCPVSAPTTPTAWLTRVSAAFRRPHRAVNALVSGPETTPS